MYVSENYLPFPFSFNLELWNNIQGEFVTKHYNFSDTEKGNYVYNGM